MILRWFLEFCESGPHDSYKNDSYKKKCVVGPIDWYNDKTWPFYKTLNNEGWPWKIKIYDYLGPNVSCFLELQDQVSYKTGFLQKSFKINGHTNTESSLLHLIGERR